MGINLNDPRSATERGFGRMWTPASDDNPRTDMVQLTVLDRDARPKTFVGGVHPLLHDLMQLIVNECTDRGYNLTPDEYGFAWRPVRDSSPPVASNHSSGCAIDINSAFNWLGRTDGGDIPAYMRGLFNAYGFRWGGDYTGREDPMHFEFMGTTADARSMTEKARLQLGEGAAEMAAMDDYLDGWSLAADGKNLPDNANKYKTAGWRHKNQVNAAATSGGTTGTVAVVHTHAVSTTTETGPDKPLRRT